MQNEKADWANGADAESLDDGRQYLTFHLGGESYGVDILRVQEIKGWSAVTHVPNSPDYMLGVLNLRGEIIPIVDLRVRFGMAELEYLPTTVVIVLRVNGRSGVRRTMGIVVDGVSDVLNIAETMVKPTPDFGAVVNTEFISGLATVDGRMVMLIDIDRLLTSGDLTDEAFEESAA